MSRLPTKNDVIAEVEKFESPDTAGQVAITGFDSFGGSFYYYQFTAF